MWPIFVGEIHPIIAGECESAIWTRIGHQAAARIELSTPSWVEPVSPKDPFAVTANFDRLGADRVRFTVGAPICVIGALPPTLKP